MIFKNILVEKKNSIGIITINRSKVLNALNIETINEITHGIKELEEDKKIRVVILTGLGKAFIAGADISQMKNMTPIEAKEFAEAGHNMLFCIENSRLPFIAAVNGYALGGGCETLMACDIVIAAKSANPFAAEDLSKGAARPAVNRASPRSSSRVFLRSPGRCRNCHRQ